MPKGRFKNLSYEATKPVTDLLKSVMKDAETISLEQIRDRGHRGIDDGKRLATYIRKRNVIIAGFLSLLPVKELVNGITFEIVLEQHKKYYLKINNIKLRIYADEDYLLY